MKIQTSAPNVSIRLALCGLLCFAVSLMLPAISVKVLGSATNFSGLQTAAWAFGLIADAVAHGFAASAGRDAKYIVVGIAGVLNVTFLAVPAALLWDAQRRTVLRWLMAAVLAGLVLGIVAPHLLAEAVVLTGHVVWLAGYALLLAALASALRQPRTP